MAEVCFLFSASVLLCASVGVLPSACGLVELWQSCILFYPFYICLLFTTSFWAFLVFCGVKNETCIFSLKEKSDLMMHQMMQKVGYHLNLQVLLLDVCRVRTNPIEGNGNFVISTTAMYYVERVCRRMCAHLSVLQLQHKVYFLQKKPLTTSVAGYWANYVVNSWSLTSSDLRKHFLKVVFCLCSLKHSAHFFHTCTAWYFSELSADFPS